MADYVNNHDVPRCLIDRWHQQGFTYPGVFAYEIETRKKRFWAGKGRRPYSFAIVEDLYIPVIEGQRSTAVEQWLSRVEGTLSDLVRQGVSGEQLALKSPHYLAELGLALVSMMRRSRFELAKIEEWLQADRSRAAQISANPEGKSPKQLAAENLMNAAFERAHAMSPFEIQLGSISCEDEPLILSDRPYFDGSNDFNLLTVDPRLVIRFGKSPLGTWQFYESGQFTSPMARSINKRTALQARYWLVAMTEAQLDEYVAIVESDEWSQRRDGESLRQDKPRYLRGGFGIPPGVVRS